MKIVITGPECSGKTTLFHTLAAELAIPAVPELTVPYLRLRNGQYNVNDLEQLCVLQNQVRQTLAAIGHNIILFDTSYLVLKVWSWYRYRMVPQGIEYAFAKVDKTHYLLCQPLQTYQPDLLRENPHDRWALYHLYLKDLWSQGKSYSILRGTQEERLSTAMASIPWPIDQS